MVLGLVSKLIEDGRFDRSQLVGDFKVFEDPSLLKRKHLGYYCFVEAKTNLPNEPDSDSYGITSGMDCSFDDLEGGKEMSEYIDKSLNTRPKDYIFYDKGGSMYPNEVLDMRDYAKELFDKCVDTKDITVVTQELLGQYYED